MKRAQMAIDAKIIALRETYQKSYNPMQQAKARYALEVLEELARELQTFQDADRATNRENAHLYRCTIIDNETGEYRELETHAIKAFKEWAKGCGYDVAKRGGEYLELSGSATVTVERVF